MQGFGVIHGKLPCLWRALKRLLAIIMCMTTAAVGFVVLVLVVVFVIILCIKLHGFEWSVNNLIFLEALLFLVYNFV